MFCVISSVSHIVAEEFSPTLLYKVASVHWRLLVFVYAQLLHDNISIRLRSLIMGHCRNVIFIHSVVDLLPVHVIVVAVGQAHIWLLRSSWLTQWLRGAQICKTNPPKDLVPDVLWFVQWLCKSNLTVSPANPCEQVILPQSFSFRAVVLRFISWDFCSLSERHMGEFSGTSTLGKVAFTYTWMLEISKLPKPLRLYRCSHFKSSD